jgi:LysM repeat protein
MTVGLPPRTAPRCASLAAAALLLLGACGGDDDTTTEERPTTTSVPEPTSVPTIQPTAVASASPTTDPAVPGAGGTYTVQAGDTLGTIATTLGVSLADLAAANNLAEPYVIFPGDELVVPG